MRRRQSVQSGVVPDLHRREAAESLPAQFCRSFQGVDCLLDDRNAPGPVAQEEFRDAVEEEVCGRLRLGGGRRRTGRFGRLANRPAVAVATAVYGCFECFQICLARRAHVERLEPARRLEQHRGAVGALP